MGSGSFGRRICRTNETVCGEAVESAKLERLETSGGASECPFNTSQNRILAF